MSKLCKITINGNSKISPEMQVKGYFAEIQKRGWTSGKMESVLDRTRPTYDRILNNPLECKVGEFIQIIKACYDEDPPKDGRRK